MITDDIRSKESLIVTIILYCVLGCGFLYVFNSRYSEKCRRYAVIKETLDLYSKESVHGNL